MLSIFNCCQNKCQQQSDEQIQVIVKTEDKSQQIQYYKKPDDIPLSSRRQRFNQIIAKRKSKYQSILEDYRDKQDHLVDKQFPPNHQSVGNIQNLNIKFSQWKRISEIIQNPVLFDKDIAPTDVIQGILGDCYFLSAIAALAEDPQNIRKLFTGKQHYNQQGIYKITMRVDGIIQDVIVDDYIPVNEKGKALFCQPNGNQFWVLILQKAWAKVQGSYANIISGSPAQIFKAFTYAPSQSIYLQDNLSKQDQEKIWQKIIDYAAVTKDYPCVVGTNDLKYIDWDRIGLISGHAYTLLDVANVSSYDGKQYKMMKLRNPWGHKEWQGQGSQGDKAFWQKIVPSFQKTQFLKDMKTGNDGIFFLRFYDFCKYFYQIHFCLLQDRSNYISEKMKVNGKNGELFRVYIYDRGVFTFQLHQQDMRGQRERRKRQGLSRGTLLIMKNDFNDNYFIDGKMRYNDQDISLSVQLKEGSYLLFAKLDPTRNLNILPEKASVSIYSTYYASLNPVSQQQNPLFMHKSYLGLARTNKKNEYLDGKMWVSFDIMLHKGGYGYIAFGNQKGNRKKFVIEFKQRDFNEMGYKLKKPLKKRRNIFFEVLPGNQQIILVRIQNREITNVSFPPPIKISIQSI